MPSRSINLSLKGKSALTLAFQPHMREKKRVRVIFSSLRMSKFGTADRGVGACVTTQGASTTFPRMTALGRLEIPMTNHEMSSPPLATPARKRGRPPGGDRRDKIVARSIALFNRRGIANVSIGSIAADMKMSPGNITYYFKRKRDLTSACLEVLKKDLRIGSNRPPLASAEDAADYVIAALKAVWQFRFFFNGVNYILAKDRSLRQDYYDQHDWTINQISSDLQQLIELGYFRAPEAPNSLQMLVRCLWTQWLNWLRMQQVEHPLAAMPSEAAMLDCTIQFWCTCQPYLEPRFGCDLFAAFEKKLSAKRARAAKAARDPNPKATSRKGRAPADDGPQSNTD